MARSAPAGHALKPCAHVPSHPIINIHAMSIMLGPLCLILVLTHVDLTPHTFINYQTNVTNLHQYSIKYQRSILQDRIIRDYHYSFKSANAQV
jgi:hypothetical protein